LSFDIPEDRKRIREINQEIKFEALATHRIACKLIN
jgi:hypothetical protein